MSLIKTILILSLLAGQAAVFQVDTEPSWWTNVELSSFYSPSRGRAIDFAIYIPPGYSESTMSYPVLYFLHGKGGNFLLYWGGISGEVLEARGDAGAWISGLITSGTIPPLIIVTPDDEDGAWGAVNESMVTEELISHIDANWRTIPDRRGRAIEGFSMGGMGASRYASRHPDLYCSTIIMAEPGLDSAVPYWEENRSVILQNQMGVRLAVGDQDEQLQPMNSLHNSLLSLDIPHEYEIVPGIDHNFGQLYNRIGIIGLQFHAACFQQFEIPKELPYKHFIPLAPRRHIPG
jgi:enterochelin esterase-like enzyme